eukprot:4255038-Prymnesium_polylepis.1
MPRRAFFVHCSSLARAHPAQLGCEHRRARRPGRDRAAARGPERPPGLPARAAAHGRRPEPRDYRRVDGAPPVCAGRQRRVRA